jgi:L-ascorbate metabolism protein UlaG (beta-lactamase superfamily)
MRITKLVHSCLFVEEGRVRLLIDPGKYSYLPDSETIDVILLSHKHRDHCDIELIQQVVMKNPRVRIITNQEVGSYLNESSIVYEVMKSGSTLSFEGVAIEAFEGSHALKYPTDPEPAPINTAFLINQRFFYPGDSFIHPEREVEILALPVAGGWLKSAESIDFARALRPKVCFPIHDGTLIPGRYAGFHKIPAKILPQFNIRFLVPEHTPMEFA